VEVLQYGTLGESCPIGWNWTVEVLHAVSNGTYFSMVPMLRGDL
jgi:hypothetical protein